MTSCGLGPRPVVEAVVVQLVYASDLDHFYLKASDHEVLASYQMVLMALCKIKHNDTTCCTQLCMHGHWDILLSQELIDQTKI